VREWGVIALITLLAAVVRFATLGVQSLWLDEALTVHLLAHSFPTSMHDVLATQGEPPPYFVLAWPWVKVFGAGEVGLRSLSALLGTLTVPVAWAAAKIVAGRRAAHVTALLTALAPPMIWYSQEARAYSLFIFLGALSLLFFLRSTEAPTRANLWLWAVTSLLAVSSHYFAVFAVVPQAMWLAWRVVDRRGDWPPFAALVGGLLLLAPVILFQREHGGAEWIAFVDFTERLRNTAVLAVGGPILPGGLEGRRALFAIAVTVLLVVASAIALARTHGAARGRTFVILAVGVTAIVLPALAALVGSDFFYDRNLLAAWLPLAVVVAVGISALRAPVAAAVVAVVVGFFAYVGIATVTDPALQREDWNEVAERIGQGSTDRIVEVDPNWDVYPLRLYTYIAPPPSMPLAGTRPVREVVTVTHLGYVVFDEPRNTRAPGPPFVETRRFQVGPILVVDYKAPKPVPLDPATLTAPGRSGAWPYFQPGR
jgi:mannosyltransferase